MKKIIMLLAAALVAMCCFVGCSGTSGSVEKLEFQGEGAILGAGKTVEVYVNVTKTSQKSVELT